MASIKATNPWQNHVRDPRKLDNDSLTRVDRDPCPKCGTRADHGCKHRGAQS